MSTLELVGLTKHFTGVDAVNDVNISVGDVDRPPVLSPIDDQVINENGTLTLKLIASDPDGCLRRTTAALRLRLH